MSTKINKAVALRVIEEFEGNGDLAVSDELFAPTYRSHFPGVPTMDQKGHAQRLSLLRNAFPDMTTTVLFQIAEGDRVANHLLWLGTHRGKFQGISATGKSVLITENNVMHFEHGKITERWNYPDSVGMRQQLGIIPVGPYPAPTAIPLTPAQTGGSSVKPAEMVYRFIENFNNKELQMIGRDFSDDYKLDFPGGPTGFGPDGVRQAAGGFIAAFPDLWFRIDDLFSEDNRVAWRWAMTGTHKGNLGPVPASGKVVAFSGISLFRIKNGKIVEDKVRADMVGLLQQIGAIPTQGKSGN